MPSLAEIHNLGLEIILVAGWLGLILGVAEGLNRGFSVNAEVSRKIVHIGTGNVIL
ncbi:MAG: phosphatidate cytidylyltransferase, partial [Planktothrix sp.]